MKFLAALTVATLLTLTQSQVKAEKLTTYTMQANGKTIQVHLEPRETVVGGNIFFAKCKNRQGKTYHGQGINPVQARKPGWLPGTFSYRFLSDKTPGRKLFSADYVETSGRPACGISAIGR